MLRSWLVAVASTALVVATASPSSALVTASFDGGVIDDDANDFVTVRCEGGTMRAGASNSSRPCGQLFSITVFSGGGTDTINLSQVTAASFTKLLSTTTFASGNGSTDILTGSPFLDLVYGDSFDTVATGAGDDIINGVKEARGEAGNDTFRTITGFASGGEGDDRFIRIQPQFGVDGGVGNDVWELELDYQSGTSLVLDQSGLVVTEPNILPSSRPATTLEHVIVTLSAGAQTWDGTAFPGQQWIRGLDGADTLVGGSGRDVLDGDAGDDAITGAAGGDALTGGEGNDVIQARDGEVDVVDCGAGTDTVVADAADAVVNCETVDVPAAPPVVTPPAQVVLVPLAPVTNAVTGPAKLKKGKAGTFTFSSPTAGATFQCQLDNRAWKSCASPYKVRTKKLTLGKHTLLVRALIGGAADATPSKKTFKVVRG